MSRDEQAGVVAELELQPRRGNAIGGDTPVGARTARPTGTATARSLRRPRARPMRWSPRRSPTRAARRLAPPDPRRRRAPGGSARRPRASARRRRRGRPRGTRSARRDARRPRIVGDEHDRPSACLNAKMRPKHFRWNASSPTRRPRRGGGVRVEERRDREAEAHRHPRRVRPDRPVDRVLELGERDDLVEPAPDLGPREALDRAVQEDVLAAREVRVEPGAELEQGADPTRRLHAPAVGLMIPATRRSRVVLPEPLRPMRPTASPRATSTETSRSAQTSVACVCPRWTKRSFSVRASRPWIRKRARRLQPRSRRLPCRLE